MAMSLDPRRGAYIDVTTLLPTNRDPLSARQLEAFEAFDLTYRALCAILYNYVPMSGHPGGSISSGRFVAGLLFDTLDYDFSRPDREDADIVSYAAGHKAMGLYSLWALRDELARIGAPEIAARTCATACASRTCWASAATRSRARRCSRASAPRPSTATPLRPLPSCGWPPARPASGSPPRSDSPSAARDYYGGERAPRPRRRGRGRPDPRAASPRRSRPPAPPRLDNVVVHLDWNQASIDSDRVCRDGRRARRLRAVDAAGAVLAPRLERHLRPRRHRLPAGHRGPAPGGRPSTRASPPPSSTARSRAGSTASRAAPPTAPATSSAREGFYKAMSRRSTQLAGSVPAQLRARARAAARTPRRGTTVMEECFWDALCARARPARGVARSWSRPWRAG